ncbi:Uncharacterized HTH-type transcriptional regulator yegW [Raoultella planticola]|uniref:Uncharacterized HTH-type transcriptional regulator yegW n=1 Tax=Raoultella planticola TaxID=575 RepID=A0A485ADN3_RAOPL|nr:Uncharacterized HTH-type transcriptional regulator yegW [Raoultella planticola]
MEQAHTRLITQLVERIAASDNAPLYLKFCRHDQGCRAQRLAGKWQYSSR